MNLAADGQWLTGALVHHEASAGTVELLAVDQPSALLNYVFGHGEHQVVLHLEGLSMQGYLNTSWHEHARCWWVEVEAVTGTSTADPSSELPGIVVLVA